MFRGLPGLQAVLEKASRLHRQGKLREAETLYRRVLLADPRQPQALALLGGLLGEGDRPTEGDLLIRRALAGRPDDPGLHVALGDSELRGGDLDAAEACYRAALQFDAAHEEGVLTLAEMLLDRDRLEEAERVLRGALRQEPAAGPGVLRLLADVCERRGRAAEAEQLYEQVHESVPEDERVLLALGRLRLADERPHAALAAYQGALLLDDRLAEAQKGLGDCLLGLGRAEEAVAAFRRATLVDPAYGPAWQALVRSLIELGDPEAAGEVLERASTAIAGGQSWMARLYGALAGAWQASGAADRALSAAVKGLAQDPQELSVYAGLAPILRDTGRAAEAEMLFDFRRLLYWRQLRQVPDYPSPAAFNRALAEWLRERSGRRHARPEDGLRGGWCSEPLFERPSRPLLALERQIAAAVADYLELHGGAAGNPFLARPPERLRLRGRALGITASGWLEPQVRDGAFLSGLYFATVPRAVIRGEDAAGCLRFWDAEWQGDGTRIETLRPRPGLLALFPSYFRHGTLPFRASRECLGVLFDLVAEDRLS